jgi:hypothetical protein
MKAQHDRLIAGARTPPSRLSHRDRFRFVMYALTAAWAISVGAFAWWLGGIGAFAIALWFIVGGTIAIVINRPWVSLLVGLVVPVWILFGTASGDHHRVGHQVNACFNQMYSISAAISDYQFEHGHFPPAFIADAEGRPMHSWRVLILPYLSRPWSRDPVPCDTYSDVYARYRMDEPWDRPNNAALAPRVDAYRCPAQRRSTTATPYLAVVGERAFWPGSNTRKPEDVPDGLSRTVCLVEATPIDNWMEPKDLSFAEALDYLASDQSQHMAVHHVMGWTISEPLWRRVQMADSHTESVSVNQPRDVVAAALDIADGKPARSLKESFVRPKPRDPGPWGWWFMGLAIFPAFIPLMCREVRWLAQGLLWLRRSR